MAAKICFPKLSKFELQQSKCNYYAWLNVAVALASQKISFTFFVSGKKHRKQKLLKQFDPDRSAALFK